MTLKEKLYDFAPSPVKNLLVTLFDVQNLISRRTGNYRNYKSLYRSYESETYEDLLTIQSDKFKEFISYLKDRSPFHESRLKELTSPEDINRLQDIPILEKDELKSNVQSIMTIGASEGISAFTGGTTGMPLGVVFTKDNFRERVATIDNFREKHGFIYGRSKVAWFSGRKILSERDEKKKRFWRYDPLLRIRYYSTFHISAGNKPHYIKDLNRFQPSFISGFPSAIYDLAAYIESSGVESSLKIKAIFTTSETLLPYARERIERVFSCKVYDQYSSGEGAPYIYECCAGNLHYALPSGIIEIVDRDDKPAKEGEMLVTSFTSYGTPLLRYRIGDYGVLSDLKCSCGLNYPVFERIEGRSKDFIYSEQRGKLYNAQIGDVVKAEITGLKNIQVIQEAINRISLNMVTTDEFESGEMDQLISKLRDRVGETMEINLIRVDNLQREKSGKVKLIINNALDEINEILSNEE